MLLLPSTTDKLQLVTSAAATIDVHVSYMDHTTATDDVVGNRQNTAITTATTTDILAAPGAGVVRNAKTIHVRNKHATLSCDVTVVYDANGTDYELHKATLLAGEALEYVEGIGFFTLTNPTAALVRTKKLGADQSNSTTTLTEVTGMSIATGVGTFAWKYNVIYRAAAATTGVRFSVNHSGTVTAFVAQRRYVDTSATAATAVPDQDAVGAAAQVMGAFAARAKSTLGWGTQLSVDTADADMLEIIEGSMVVTVDGDIELWHGSEVAAASTVRAGTSLVLIRASD